jgi:hypothetical protein
LIPFRQLTANESPLAQAVTNTRSDTLTLGDKTYKRLPFTYAIHAPKFKDFAKLQACIRSLTPPSSLAQWRACVGTITETARVLTNVGTLNEKDSYTSMWLCRAVLMAEMRCAGIMRLKFRSSDLVTAVAATFPDQNEWLIRVARVLDVQQIGDVIKAAKYQGPLELFSAWLCVICSTGVLGVAATKIGDVKGAVVRARRTLRQAHGYEAHPLHVLQQVCLV